MLVPVPVNLKTLVLVPELMIFLKIVSGTGAGAGLAAGFSVFLQIKLNVQLLIFAMRRLQIGSTERPVFAKSLRFLVCPCVCVSVCLSVCLHK